MTKQKALTRNHPVLHCGRKQCSSGQAANLGCTTPLTSHYPLGLDRRSGLKQMLSPDVTPRHNLLPRCRRYSTGQKLHCLREKGELLAVVANVVPLVVRMEQEVAIVAMMIVHQRCTGKMDLKENNGNHTMPHTTLVLHRATQHSDLTWQGRSTGGQAVVWLLLAVHVQQHPQGSSYQPRLFGSRLCKLLQCSQAPNTQGLHYCHLEPTMVVAVQEVSELPEYGMAEDILVLC